MTAAQGGAPLGGLAVWLLDAEGNAVDLTTTNADGGYTLSNVPAGTWYVEFVGGLAYDGRYYATEYYLGQPALGGAKPIRVAAGQRLGGIDEALLGPRNVSWNRAALGRDIVIPRDKFHYAIGSGRLRITLAAGKRTVNSRSRRAVSSSAEPSRPRLSGARSPPSRSR